MDSHNYLQFQGQRYKLTEEDLDSHLTKQEGRMSLEDEKVVGVTVPNQEMAKKCLEAWRSSLRKRPDPILESNIKLVESWSKKKQQKVIAECARRHLQRFSARG